MACQLALKLIDAAVVTVTGASTATTIPKGYNKWIARASVGVVTGTNPTLDITFQHSYDGTNWTTLIAMDQIIATGGHIKFAAAATDYLKPLMPYVRVSYTVGGTATPTFNTTNITLFLDV